jgi:hypothetical protein
MNEPDPDLDRLLAELDRARGLEHAVADGISYAVRLQRHFEEWSHLRRGGLVEDMPAGALRIPARALLAAATAYELHGQRISTYPSAERLRSITELAEEAGLNADEIKEIWKWWADSGCRVRSV